jgi:hypothetical protein
MTRFDPRSGRSLQPVQRRESTLRGHCHSHDGGRRFCRLWFSLDIPRLRCGGQFVQRVELSINQRAGL